MGACSAATTVGTNNCNANRKKSPKDYEEDAREHAEHAKSATRNGLRISRLYTQDWEPVSVALAFRGKSTEELRSRASVPGGSHTTTIARCQSQSSATCFR